LELAEADHNIRHLHAGVVDVVLDLDTASLEPKEPAEGVAERRVTQVADVRRLVRVDGGVLDDDFFVRVFRGRLEAALQPRFQPLGSIEKEVDVAVRGRFDARNAVDLPERPRKFLRDGPRRLAQPTGQREGDRDGEVSKCAPRRCFERHLADDGILRRDAVKTADGLGHMTTNELVNGENHCSSVIRSGNGSDITKFLARA
jgi:hypothetical protein